MQRASYRDGIAWIALNDDPEDRNPDQIALMISVLLLADLFGIEPEKVAADVIAFRNKQQE